MSETRAGDIRHRLKQRWGEVVSEHIANAMVAREFAAMVLRCNRAGMTQKAIAAYLGVSPKRISQLVFRAERAERQASAVEVDLLLQIVPADKREARRWMKALFLE